MKSSQISLNHIYAICCTNLYGYWQFVDVSPHTKETSSKVKYGTTAAALGLLSSRHRCYLRAWAWDIWELHSFDTFSTINTIHFYLEWNVKTIPRWWVFSISKKGRGAFSILQSYHVGYFDIFSEESTGTSVLQEKSLPKPEYVANNMFWIRFNLLQLHNICLYIWVNVRFIIPFDEGFSPFSLTVWYQICVGFKPHLAPRQQSSLTAPSVSRLFVGWYSQRK